MTQMLKAREGKITKEMQQVANFENKSPEYIRDKVAIGEIAIPANINHKMTNYKGIGAGLKTKINANFGMSKGKESMDYELEKLQVAIEMGSDTVMDLSIGGDIDLLLKTVIAQSPVPVGTVPAYQTISQKGMFFTADDLFETIEKQAQLGVDYMTVHCGVNYAAMEKVGNGDRYMDSVSRGGGILLKWMKKNNCDNPLFEQYDRLLEIAAKYDVTLSIGDGFRPGCLHDSTDSHQIRELIVMGELTKRAWEKGVQVMIEGPGHIPLNHIKANMDIEKRLCHNAPFYVLGPLVVDCGAGYDHITAAIGGAVAAWHGADMLCYVTPAEHLRLPSLLDVKEGVAAAKIAAHAGDLANGTTSYDEIDNKISLARKNYNWEEQKKYCFDKEKFERYQADGQNKSSKEECTMCGEFCPMKGD